MVIKESLVNLFHILGGFCIQSCDNLPAKTSHWLLVKKLRRHRVNPINFNVSTFLSVPLKDSRWCTRIILLLSHWILRHILVCWATACLGYTHWGGWYNLIIWIPVIQNNKRGNNMILHCSFISRYIDKYVENSVDSVVIWSTTITTPLKAGLPCLTKVQWVSMNWVFLKVSQWELTDSSNPLAIVMYHKCIRIDLGA